MKRETTKPLLASLLYRLTAQRRIVCQLEDAGKFTEATRAFDAQLDCIREIQTNYPDYDFKDA